MNYDAINFKNKDIDKFSTKFGNGDPVKAKQQPKKPEKSSIPSEMISNMEKMKSVEVPKETISTADFEKLKESGRTMADNSMKKYGRKKP